MRPLLKKPSLGHAMSNYRPFSNLIYISKILEQVVNIKLSEHFVRNCLGEPLQSVNTSNCSKETALLKILNDALCSMDKRQAGSNDAPRSQRRLRHCGS